MKCVRINLAVLGPRTVDSDQWQSSSEFPKVLSVDDNDKTYHREFSWQIFQSLRLTYINRLQRKTVSAVTSISLRNRWGLIQILDSPKELGVKKPSPWFSVCHISPCLPSDCQKVPEAAIIEANNLTNGLQILVDPHWWRSEVQNLTCTLLIEKKHWTSHTSSISVWQLAFLDIQST